jgi:hypothetical protein
MTNPNLLTHERRTLSEAIEESKKGMQAGMGAVRVPRPLLYKMLAIIDGTPSAGPIDYAEYFGGPIKPGEVERFQQKLGLPVEPRAEYGECPRCQAGVGLSGRTLHRDGCADSGS